MKIIVRAFNPEKDSGIIFDSYPKGVFYSPYQPIQEEKSVWMKRFFEMLKKQLSIAQVFIACTENDPNTIIGYSLIEKGILQFVYVKADFRNKGIGTLLTKDKFINVNDDTLTKIGAAILSKRKEKNNEQRSEKVD